MSTASITHHPLPMATAAAVVIVGALAFGAVELTQNDTSTSPITHSTVIPDGGGQHGKPQIPHGGSVQQGLP